MQIDATRRDRDRSARTCGRRWLVAHARALVLVAMVAAAALVPRTARADYDYQFSAGLNGGWLRRTPTFSSEAVTTSAREMGPGEVETGRSLALLGVSSDLELTVDDRWRIPLVGGAASWAVGSYDSLVTSLDGSVASVRPWSMFRADLFLPGIGRRWKHRRNMWGIALRTGISFSSMGGSVAAGAESEPLSLSAATFLLQAELSACRRLDPMTRICLQIVPRLYEHELFNGATLGLRMEWGR